MWKRDRFKKEAPSRKGQTTMWPLGRSFTISTCFHDVFHFFAILLADFVSLFRKLLSFLYPQERDSVVSVPSQLIYLALVEWHNSRYKGSIYNRFSSSNLAIMVLTDERDERSSATLDLAAAFFFLWRCSLSSNEQRGWTWLARSCSVQPLHCRDEATE